MTLEGVPLGWLEFSAEGVVGLIVLLIFADKLWTERRAKAAIATALENANQVLKIVEKQRDDAMDTVRESHEVQRIQAESIRDLTESVEQLADGQEVAVHLIRSALPSPARRDP